MIFLDQKVVRLIIVSMAGRGMKARADIMRYICNDNYAGGKEITNMNIGITVPSRENEKIVFLLPLQSFGFEEH